MDPLAPPGSEDSLDVENGRRSLLSSNKTAGGTPAKAANKVKRCGACRKEIICGQSSTTCIGCDVSLHQTCGAALSSFDDEDGSSHLFEDAVFVFCPRCYRSNSNSSDKNEGSSIVSAGGGEDIEAKLAAREGLNDSEDEEEHGDFEEEETKTSSPSEMKGLLRRQSLHDEDSVPSLGGGLGEGGLGDRETTSTESTSDTQEANVGITSLLASIAAATIGEKEEERPSLKEVRKHVGPEKHGILNGAHAFFIVFIIVVSSLYFTIHYGANFENGEEITADNNNTTIEIPWPSSISGDTLLLRHDEFVNSWWLGETDQTFLSKTYGRLDELTSYRNLTDIVSPFFSEKCGQYRFQEPASFPSVSIVIGPIYENLPAGLLSRTVHSILSRTPPEMLREVILVFEHVSTIEGEEVNQDLLDELDTIEHLNPELIWRLPTQAHIVHQRTASRLRGLKRAKGNIVVVMDPNTEVLSSTWLQQLVLPVIENPRTISVPLLHMVESWQNQNYQETDTDASYFVNWNEKLDMERIVTTGDLLDQQSPSKWRPYESPFFESNVIVVDRMEFTRMKGMDESVIYTKADTIEISMKYQMCQGRIVMVPCSRVGVVPSDSEVSWDFDPPLDNALQESLDVLSVDERRHLYGKPVEDPKTTLAVRNFLRALNVWVTDVDERKTVYRAMFGTVDLRKAGWLYYQSEWQDQDMDFDQQEILRNHLSCHTTLAWLDRHVLQKLIGRHHPWWSDNDHQ